MIEELEVLKIVTTRLGEQAIPYMMTGSMAANYYTVPRMTRDIDIVVELSDRDVERMVALFEDDFYIDQEAVYEAVSQQRLFNIIHQRYVIKVDFVVRKDTPYRREEFARRKEISIEGHRVSIVAPEDLILSKLEWAKESRSEMQLADVRSLLSVPDLDRSYLLRWSQTLGLESLYREVTE
jgi:hypothetical protein